MRAISFPRLETITLATLAGLSVMYAYAACAFVFAPAHFAALVAEMGPLESVGALACFVAAILFFGVFVKALRSKSYGRTLWLLGLAVVSAFLALEEVSWGQHIFGFATPASISALNAQHETNFPNFFGIHTQSHELGILMLLAFFVVAPLLATNDRLARVFRDASDARCAAANRRAIRILLRGVRSILYHLFPSQDVNYGELQETAYELLLLLFAVTLFAFPETSQA